MSALFRAPLVILDTETTGFPGHDWSSVIELGAVCLDIEGNEVATFEELCCPLVLDSRCDKALEINHISRSQLAGKPPPSVVVRQFIRWMEQHGNPRCGSFNADFDGPMVDRMGEGTGRLRWSFCVMQKAAGIMGPAGALTPSNRSHPRFDAERPWLWPSLAKACEFFEVAPVEPAHRALSDARMAAGIARAIRHHDLARGAA